MLIEIWPGPRNPIYLFQQVFGAVCDLVVGLDSEPLFYVDGDHELAYQPEVVQLGSRQAVISRPEIHQSLEDKIQNAINGRDIDGEILTGSDQGV